MDAPTVLVVDPDARSREATVAAVRDALPDATVRDAASLGAAREAAEREGHVDAVVTEYDLGDGTGLDLAEAVRERAPDAGCILYTAATGIDTGSAGGTVLEYVHRGSEGGREQLAAALEAATVDRSQAAYPLPDDEIGRIEAVESYLRAADAVDAELDRITDVAARHFGVGVASITLVREHEQEFLAASGEDLPPTDRDGSICTFTIVEDEVMAVPDTAADPRFADSDGLRAAGIRAYLGAPLRTAGGHTIGALCVYDDGVREFSASDREFLATLAALAVDVLELAGGVRP